MGDFGLPLRGRTPASENAVDPLLSLSERFPGELTLVTLGPLTNVALAVLRDPAFVTRIQSCVVMGGIGYGHGNVTPVAEYNIWVAPEAAAIVFGSGLPLTMVGWDVSRQYAAFTREEAAALRAIGTPLAEFCVDVQGSLHAFATTVTGLPGFDLPDPIAMAVALDPTVATETKQLHVAVETSSGLCRGQTVVDHTGVTKQPPNTRVVLHADRCRFLALLEAAVAAP